MKYSYCYTMKLSHAWKIQSSWKFRITLFIQISTCVNVQGLENVQLVVAGAFYNLALPKGREVWACGNNEYGLPGKVDTLTR